MSISPSGSSPLAAQSSRSRATKTRLQSNSTSTRKTNQAATSVLGKRKSVSSAPKGKSVSRSSIQAASNAETSKEIVQKAKKSRGDAKLLSGTVEKKRETSNSIEIKGTFNAPLSKDIKKEYNLLIGLIGKVKPTDREIKAMTLSSHSVSVTDLIAYQIGWGKRVIEWYETGIAGKMPVMPGDGFTTFSYKAMATHFFKTYRYDCGSEQDQVFHGIVTRILEIVEEAHKNNTLDTEGVWEWATLQSGKHWPLSKWVRVNTASPYNRAAKLVRGFLK